MRVYRSVMRLFVRFRQVVHVNYDGWEVFSSCEGT